MYLINEGHLCYAIQCGVKADWEHSNKWKSKKCKFVYAWSCVVVIVGVTCNWWSLRFGCLFQGHSLIVEDQVEMRLSWCVGVRWIQCVCVGCTSSKSFCSLRLRPWSPTWYHLHHIACLLLYQLDPFVSDLDLIYIAYNFSTHACTMWYSLMVCIVLAYHLTCSTSIHLSHTCSCSSCSSSSPILYAQV